ncbi:hypothetical protein, partial [Variovorax sp. GT1P44]|uniref:hypothetical protein n=1 Tax=Variovorax sp. GT1P44 TaxID=3443742 RepID=UPI003F491592
MQTFFNHSLRFAPEFQSGTSARFVLSGAFDYDTIFSIPPSPKTFFLRLLQPPHHHPHQGSSSAGSFSAEPWIM